MAFLHWAPLLTLLLQQLLGAVKKCVRAEYEVCFMCNRCRRQHLRAALDMDILRWAQGVEEVVGHMMDTVQLLS